jgi:NAD(P)H dehydrogenase (quinone)
VYENGLLKGKKAMLSFTTGGSPENFGMGTRKGPLLERLYSIHHEKLYYCGIRSFRTICCMGPTTIIHGRKRKGIRPL